MNTFGLYDWALPYDETSFVDSYHSQNDALTERLHTWWQTFAGADMWYILIFVACAFMFALWYYTDFNNRPGRHYTPKWWGLFGLWNMIATLILTFVVSYFLITNQQGYGTKTMTLQISLAFINAVYSAVAYLFFSFVWCNWLPTNAYKLLNISK